VRQIRRKLLGPGRRHRDLDRPPVQPLFLPWRHLEVSAHPTVFFARVRYLLSLSPRVSAKEPRQEAPTLFHLFHGADLKRRGEPKHAGHQRHRGGTQEGAKAL
jgi:hypothetical protein